MWTIPAKSIDAATTSTTGAVVDLDEVKSDHAAQASATFGIAGDRVDVVLQGSLDNVNWFTVASASVTGGLTETALLAAELKPARYVRTVSFVVSGSSTLTTHVTSRD